MLRAYHKRIVDLAEAAVATGRPSIFYLSLAKAAAIWTVPAIFAIFVCCGLGLKGSALLLVCLPLVAITIAGCCGYVGGIYWRAMMQGS